jgi:hypothetical protein
VEQKPVDWISVGVTIAVVAGLVLLIVDWRDRRRGDARG